MARLVFASIVLAVLVLQINAQKGSCPLASRITACTPKCKDDTECFGKRCCSNICNTKSCVPDNIKSQDDSRRSGSSATGTYCGNVKCSPFEKCQLDKTTKRQTCVRS